MRMLLHACCGPCLIEPLDALRADHEVTVLYANPNIQPREEYDRRLATLRTYASDARIAVIEEAYDPESWHVAVAGREHDQRERCRACYRLRLEIAARVATSEGFESFSTTLTVSPYQDLEGIREAGEAASARTGVRFYHRDFRDRYREALRRARDLDLYRQNYCGCLPSRAEVEADRAERRERRRVRPSAVPDSTGSEADLK